MPLINIALFVDWAIHCSHDDASGVGKCRDDDIYTRVVVGTTRSKRLVNIKSKTHILMIGMCIVFSSEKEILFLCAFPPASLLIACGCY